MLSWTLKWLATLPHPSSSICIYNTPRRRRHAHAKQQTYRAHIYYRKNGSHKYAIPIPWRKSLFVRTHTHISIYVLRFLMIFFFFRKSSIFTSFHIHTSPCRCNMCSTKNIIYVKHRRVTWCKCIRLLANILKRLNK